MLGQVEDAEKEIINQRLKVKEAQDKLQEMDSLKKIPYYADIIDNDDVSEAISALSKKLGLPEPPKREPIHAKQSLSLRVAVQALSRTWHQTLRLSRFEPLIR